MHFDFHEFTSNSNLSRSKPFAIDDVSNGCFASNVLIWTESKTVQSMCFYFDSIWTDYKTNCSDINIEHHQSKRKTKCGWNVIEAQNKRNDRKKNCRKFMRFIYRYWIRSGHRVEEKEITLTQTYNHVNRMKLSIHPSRNGNQKPSNIHTQWINCIEDDIFNCVFTQYNRRQRGFLYMFNLFCFCEKLFHISIASINNFKPSKRHFQPFNRHYSVKTLFNIGWNEMQTSASTLFKLCKPEHHQYAYVIAVCFDEQPTMIS